MQTLYLANSAILSWPIYQDQLKLAIKSHAFICITKKTIEKSQNAWFHHGFLCLKTIMIGRLTKWNLICFTSMHTAKDTRQVLKWREMISG